MEGETKAINGSDRFMADGGSAPGGLAVARLKEISRVFVHVCVTEVESRYAVDDIGYMVGKADFEMPSLK